MDEGTLEKLRAMARGEDVRTLRESASKLMTVWPEYPINWNLVADIVLRDALKEFNA